MLAIDAKASLISEPEENTDLDAKNPVNIEVADSRRSIVNAVCDIIKVSQQMFSFPLGNLL